MHDVAYVVATFNQSLEKTLQTIHSILLQRNVDSMMVIADDGSKNNNRSEIENYLRNKSYTDFVFLESERNQGTVLNLYRCKECCDSKYIKLISPGDFIYGSETIKNWMHFMEEHELDASVSDAYFYSFDNKVRVIKSRQCPCGVKPYIKGNKKTIREQMLIRNDLWLGAATFMRTEVFFKYLKMIQKKVVYGEDNVYRIMAADEMNLGFFKENAILYERGQGVTSESIKNDEWRKKLMKDWEETTKIIIEGHLKDESFKKKFVCVSEWKMKSTVRFNNVKKMGFLKIAKQMLPLYVRIPSMLIWHLNNVFFPRYSAEPNIRIVEEIMNYNV